MNPRTWARTNRSPSAAPAHSPVVVTLECTVSPEERFGTPHPIMIHADWRVETLHDLEAERVGRSLGGWCSCLHFVDRIIPVYREAMHIMVDPGQLPHHGRRWGNIQTEIAHSEGWTELDFSRFPHAELGDALRQEISAEHLLALNRMEGILPVSVDGVARAIPKTAWPLPIEFFRRACLVVEGSWLYNAVNCFPTREFAEWAVSQDRDWDRTQFNAVWRMQELDLSASDAIGALEARIPLEALTELAGRPGLGGPTAARWLTIWSRLGVTPSSDHYRLLEAHRALTSLPPRWALDATASTLRKFGPDAPARVELAVMLALTNSTNIIELAVRTGIRTATDDKFMEIVHQGRPN